MIATNKFRWLYPKPHTAEDIRREIVENGLSMLEAASKLKQKAEKPKLQQWYECEGHEHPDYLKAGGEWEDVEIVYADT